MRIKGPTVRQRNTKWIHVQVSPTEVRWHRDSVKRWLYTHIVNRLNRTIWKYFQREIDLE